MIQLSLKDHIKARPFPLKAIVSGSLFERQRERMREVEKLNFYEASVESPSASWGILKVG